MSPSESTNATVADVRTDVAHPRKNIHYGGERALIGRNALGSHVFVNVKRLLHSIHFGARVDERVVDDGIRFHCWRTHNTTQYT